MSTGGEARSGAGEGREPMGVEIPKVGVPARVLLVEDNVDLAEGLAMVLKIQGHEVRVVHEALAAVESAQSSIPDVIILDIGLPGISGYEAARRIRTDPALGTVVLVALTGHDLEGDRQRALAAGFDHHLVKPVEMDVIDDLLARCTPPARVTQGNPSGIDGEKGKPPPPQSAP